MDKLLMGGVLVLLAPLAWAHGGGLNAEGCHNNRKTGEYHCHRGGSRSARPAPGGTAPGESAATLTPRRQAPSNSGGPTCYTGPRGGTYTITPSGRKNYSGC